MKSGLRIALLSSCLLLVSSCSFVDRFDGFHAGEGPLTLQTFIPRFFDGLCQKAIRCESKLGIGALLEITCHPAVGELYLSRVFGSVGTFDAEVAQRCLDGLASIDCSVSNTLFVSECEQLLSGVVQNGSPCQSDVSCVGGRCEQPPGACTEICVDKGNQGDLCTMPYQDSECDSQLRCRGGSCELPGQAGDVCENANDCASLLWCDPSGTCQPLPNVGDQCLNGSTTNYSDPCRGSLVCKLDPGGSTRSCQPGGTAGMACSSDAPCAPGHRCDAGLCHLISGPGGTCVSKVDCPYLHECVAETCVPYGAIGDACSPTLPCMQGSCVGQVCTALPDGSSCDGSNGLLGGQCQNHCQSVGGSIYVCAPLGGVGAACADAFDSAACQSGLVCADQGAGSFACSTCP